jgi:hypothetical protein
VHVADGLFPPSASAGGSKERLIAHEPGRALVSCTPGSTAIITGGYRRDLHDEDPRRSGHPEQDDDLSRGHVAELDERGFVR